MKKYNVNWIIIFSGICMAIPLQGQFYQETKEVPQEIYQNYELYHDLNNRFYEQSQEFQFFKQEEYEEEAPVENYAYDDIIVDPPIDDDAPVPIGKFWSFLIFLSGLGLGLYFLRGKIESLAD